MHRFASLSVVALLSCTATPDLSEAPSEKRTAADAISTLRRLGAVRPVATAKRLTALLPERASAALRLGEGDAWIEVTPDGMRDTEGTTSAFGDGDATVFVGAARDVDLVYVHDAGRVEELRLARTTSAAVRSTWHLRKGPGISTFQIVDGRIEAVDHRGVVRVQSEAAFAIDSRGTSRPLQLALQGSTVVATLDVTGMVAPIAVDPAWVAAAAPSGLARVDTPMVLLSNGKVLLAGGSSIGSASAYSTASVYDPSTNTWTATMNSLAGPRAEHTATKLGTDKVALIAGYGSNDLSTIEVYDEGTNSFGTAVTMPQITVPGPFTTAARRKHGAVRLASGEVLVIGGQVGSTMTDSLVVLPLSGTGPSLLGTPLPERLQEPNVLLLADGRVLVAGGATTTGSGGVRYTKRAFTITISGASASIAPLDFLPVGRVRALPLVAPVGPHAGRAMFVGGAVSSLSSENTLITSQGGVVYDATAGKWLPIPLMATKRFLSAGGLLPGGRVLVTGGSSDTFINGTANQDAEILDLATMTWKSAGKMLEPRGGHSAQVLADGSALLLGGVSAITDGFLTLSTGAERFTVQTSGAACAADGECSSGFCADGVCCDKACKGQCEACDGATSKGTCTPVTGAPRGGRAKCAVEIGADPGCALACNGVDVAACNYPGAAATCSANGCVAGRETHASTCDGAGKCKDVPRACGDYACDATTCKTACTTKADCTNAAHFCEAGKCIPQQASGSPCARDEACATGLCVDGTCCESKCDGQCQACDVPGQAGKCVPLKGKPHGARADCAKDATDACKSNACDGSNTAACAGTVGPCSSYACDDVVKACKTTCAADVDCGSGFACDTTNGKCVPRTSRCIGNAEIQSADGTKSKCTAFICRDGACLDKCTSTDECQNGFLCNGTACVTNSGAATTDEGGGCSYGARRSSAWAALAVLIGLARRRRTR